MHGRHNNVLLPMAMPTQKELREAVAQIIRDVQRDRHETDQCTADRLGISIGTVRNARDEKSDLNALTIARIGAAYGAQYLDPYNALYGATARPLSRECCDPLAHLARAMSTICDMRCDHSDGGTQETPKEQLDALPTLRNARASLDAYISQIERLRAVA